MNKQVTIRQALELQHDSTPASVAAVLALLESKDFQFDADGPANGLFLKIKESHLEKGGLSIRCRLLVEAAQEHVRAAAAVGSSDLAAADTAPAPGLPLPPAQQLQRTHMPSTSSTSLVRPQGELTATAAQQLRLHGKQPRPDADTQGAAAAASPRMKGPQLPATATGKQLTAAATTSGTVQPQPQHRVSVAASSSSSKQKARLTEKQKRKARVQRTLDLHELAAKNGWTGVTSFHKLSKDPKTTKMLDKEVRALARRYRGIDTGKPETLDFSREIVIKKLTNFLNSASSAAKRTAQRAADVAAAAPSGEPPEAGGGSAGGRSRGGAAGLDRDGGDVGGGGSGGGVGGDPSGRPAPGSARQAPPAWVPPVVKSEPISPSAPAPKRRARVVLPPMPQRPDRTGC